LTALKVVLYVVNWQAVSVAGARRVGWLAAVVGLIAALAVGWSVVSAAVSGSQPAVAGQVLTIGTGVGSAQFTPGPGWVIRTAHSDPAQGWSLARGPVRVSVLYVLLLSPSQAGRLWTGLGRTLRLGGSSARLGPPAALTSASGLARRAGLTGPLSADGLSGQAVIIPDVPERFAVEIVSVAPAGDAAAAQATAAQVAGLLRFPAAA
jgi:hypothetical protein